LAARPHAGIVIGHSNLGVEVISRVFAVLTERDTLSVLTELNNHRGRTYETREGGKR
jgi:hypothetical protein